MWDFVEVAMKLCARGHASGRNCQDDANEMLVSLASCPKNELFF